MRHNIYVRYIFYMYIFFCVKSTIRMTSLSKVGQETPVTGVRIRITVTRVHKGPLACGQIALGCANAYRKDDIDDTKNYPPPQKKTLDRKKFQFHVPEIGTGTKKKSKVVCCFLGNVPGKQAGNLLISSHICLKEVHYVFERRGFRGF